MWLEQIQRIATLVQTRVQEDKLFVIAVDGCGGAGKSTLCQALAQQVELWAPTQVIKLDDFYRPLSAQQQQQLSRLEAQQAYFSTQTFLKQMLMPLTQGLSISYKPYAWLDGESEVEVRLHGRGLVIIDGVFSYSRCLRPWVDMSVFIDTPLQLRKQRLLARPQPSTDWVPHWQQTEAWHHQHEDTVAAVDFVLDGAKA
jgi:uridine kinase